jgi:hypothetical protein
MKDNSFTTTNGTRISGATMARVEKRLSTGADWQQVACDELQCLPKSEDLDEVMEVINEAESRIESLVAASEARCHREFIESLEAAAAREEALELGR